MSKKARNAEDRSRLGVVSDQDDDGKISDDTVLYHVQCKKCGNYLPPHTAWEHLNLGTDHGIFQCPHIEGSPSFPYNVRCNSCGRYLPFWIVFAANFPPCHPIHECPHDNWDAETGKCPRSDRCSQEEGDEDVQN